MRLADDATLRHLNSGTCVLEGWVKGVDGCDNVPHLCIQNNFCGCLTLPDIGPARIFALLERATRSDDCAKQDVHHVRS